MRTHVVGGSEDRRLFDVGSSSPDDHLLLVDIDKNGASNFGKHVTLLASFTRTYREGGEAFDLLVLEEKMREGEGEESEI